MLYAPESVPFVQWVPEILAPKKKRKNSPNRNRIRESLIKFQTWQQKTEVFNKIPPGMGSYHSVLNYSIKDHAEIGLKKFPD